ncbi:hypothetical protein T11_183 [Trichinella zimbabwensis]|uniref:Uncharacterized protein n=1 Tax=Trichinella zimbabwensis TaxID=268475 RepID=A0A0V1H5R2_9BILA|nr:hypothetical protein T11_183 [Trichinella zimbabwensis]
MTFYRPDRPQADRACSATGRGQPLSMRDKSNCTAQIWFCGETSQGETRLYVPQLKRCLFQHYGELDDDHFNILTAPDAAGHIKRSQKSVKKDSGSVVLEEYQRKDRSPLYVCDSIVCYVGADASATSGIKEPEKRNSLRGRIRREELQSV